MSQLPAIRYARAQRYRVVAVDGDERAVGLAEADVGEAVDFADVERVVEVGAREGVEGVLAISTDRAVVPAAVVAEALSLPSPGRDTAEAMTNKARMRACLSQAGVRQPRHVVVSRDSDLSAAFAEIGAPAVLKPADSGGQRGLFRVESADEVRSHLSDALSFSGCGEAVLEQFIEGTELNGLLVARAGEPRLLTLSDRLRPEGEGFGVGWIHLFPSALPEPALHSARTVAAAAVRALGLRDGIAFPQLVVDAAGSAFLIEIAARIPAGQMADLVRHAVGVNLFDVAFAQALGRTVPDQLIEPRFTRPVAIRFLTAQPGVLPVGTVTRIDGLNAVRESAGILDAGLYIGIGDEIAPVRVDADRKGYVIATAASASAALARADAAAERLVVQTV